MPPLKTMVTMIMAHETSDERQAYVHRVMSLELYQLPIHTGLCPLVMKFVTDKSTIVGIAFVQTQVNASPCQFERKLQNSPALFITKVYRLEAADLWIVDSQQAFAFNTMNILVVYV